MSNVKLSQSKTSYDELEKRYRGFIAPAFKIIVNNEDISKYDIAVESLSINLSTNPKSDTAKFSIPNVYNLVERDFDLYTDDKKQKEILKLGDTVVVSTGYTDQLEAIFMGYITNIEYNFSSGAPTVEVTAMDISFFMLRSGEPEKWTNKTIVDVVDDIGRRYGITDFEIEPDNKVIVELSKKNESDHKFLQTQAELRNREFFVVGKKLYFRKKSSTQTSLMKLEWGKHLTSFRVEHDIADQLSKVKVKAAIENTSEVVEVESSKVNKIGSNSTTGPDLMKKMGNIVEVLLLNVKDRAEAQQIADSRIDELSQRLVSANGSCIGFPELRAGRNIEIGGLGQKLDTLYYIESVTHTIDSSGYKASFTLKGNAV